MHLEYLLDVVMVELVVPGSVVTVDESIVKKNI